ncbi:NAD(P)/FAD-dependent oxidoreductase [Halorhabdus sp. CUG00001]|uniref:dihydrolipoyl dehydrogenase family protein n=1 Tax=Halorhabdus sp. CUG00001 TaxID=2600297 RepID=UPI00131CBB47|nr:NAD(P)/FAD-dependent oxidoreductase [Halorhabdus sp. CUG00001]
MTTHVAVVGAYGSAGSAVAEELAAEPDVELTLIDDGDPGGGLCILRGCMPSKEVLSAAEHRFSAQHDPRLVGDAPDVDLEAVVERKNEHTSSWSQHRRESIATLAERDNVEFIRDTAHFVDDRVLEVDGRRLEPDYVVIATGSNVAIPPIPGIEDVPVKTSADVLDSTEFPDSGIALGLGYIGLELIPYLTEAADMDLTVVEALPDVLREADEPFGAELLAYYREHFDVDVLVDADATAVESTTDGVRMEVATDGETRTIEADDLYAFTGREPAIERLGIEHTALEPDDGWVRDTMQAAGDDRVFVVGDVNGREPILHVAKEEGFTAAENIRRHRAGEALSAYENVHHHVIFSGLGVLPFARVGHSVESAQAAGLDYVTATRDASSDGVFKTKNVADGLARLVVGTDGTVLGYQGLHYHADVMAKTMQLAVEMDLDVRDIPDRAYHPTTPELIDGLVRDTAAKLD